MQTMALARGPRANTNLFSKVLAIFIVAFWLSASYTSALADAPTPPKMAVRGTLNVTKHGSASYTIPIVVPPGTSGMVPKLAMSYSSLTGDSILGFGWQLSLDALDYRTNGTKPPPAQAASVTGTGINSTTTTTGGDTMLALQPTAPNPAGDAAAYGGMPMITRCARTQAQDSIHGGVDFNANDRFCFGPDRLILISGTYGADGSQYRTEIETFSKITAHGSSGSGPAWFEVLTKTHLRLEFGNTTDSKVPLVAVPGSTTGPAGTARAWELDKISDKLGNYMSVAYTGGTQDLVNGQSYPTTISYTGNATTGVNLAPYNSVKFVYSNRPANDIVPTYLAGSLQQTTVLLSKIQTYNGTTLVSEYRLTYVAGSIGSSHDRLQTVTLCDAVGACLAPTTFGWQGTVGLPPTSTVTDTYTVQSGTGGFVAGDFNADGLTDLCMPDGTFFGPETGTTFTLSTYAGCPPVVAQREIGTDLNVDGYSDLVFTGESVAINNRAGAWSYPYPSNWNTILDCCQSTFTVGGDFNGDGLVDVYTWPKLTSDLPNGIHLYYGTGQLPGAPNSPFVSGPRLLQGTRSASPLAADFDGDGCTDVLAQSIDVFYSCSPAVATVVPPDTHPCGRTFRTIIGDFNGDHRDDILYTGCTVGFGALYLSTGTGFTATSFAIPALWNTAAGDYEFVTGDWNGDGKTDVAIVPEPISGSTAIIYLSTGTGFVQVASVPNITMAYTGGAADSYAADWNSDGATDIWFSRNAGNIRLLFAYVPEFMTSISNGIGATTTITYDRLNKNSPLYVKGTGATYPTQDLDNAMYVVSRVDAANGIGGNYSTTYTYAGAKVDINGRGFLGFSTVTSKDLQTGILTTTNYRTDFPYIGLVSSQTDATTATRTGCTTGVTLKSVTMTYTATNLGGTRNLVTLHQSVVSGHDCDNSVLPTLTTTYTYDAYGNATQVSASLSDGSSSVTNNTFTNDTTNWLFLLTQAAVTNTVGSSVVTRTTSYGYQTATDFLNQETVEPGSSTLLVNTVYALDSFGNHTGATTNGSNFVTRSTGASYDAQGRFVLTTTNALSQGESYTFDPKFGGMLTHTDLNGLIMSWNYDTFGRKTLETHPDGTKTVIAYFYCSGVNGGTFACVTNGKDVTQVTPQTSGGTQNGPQTVAYYDGLYRSIANDVQGFNASWIRASTIYDANEHISQTSRPYFVTGGTAKYTTYTTDDLGRATKAVFPDSSQTTYAFHGQTTSTTNNLNQTTTFTKNAQGLNASVTDALSHPTNYVYDAFGDLKTVTDFAGNVTSNAYDLRGHKTASSDPDMGSWAYTYDGLGELLTQLDANSQTTTLTYDVLDRVTQRVEPGLTSNWTWDTATHGIGELASATTSAGYSRVLTYDTIARPSTTTLTIDTVPYGYTTTYNTTNGKIATVANPSGFTFQNVYTSLGYLSQIKDNGSGSALWTANTRDAELHLLQQTAGNGVVTTDTFDANTGRMTNVRSGPSDSVAAFDYTWDTIGDLTYRSDNFQGVFERYCYDALNRLTNYAIGGSGTTTCTTAPFKTAAYDALGNITSKSDVGTYSYPPTGSAHPHAVTSIAGTVNGVTNPSYTYDLNGNMLSGAGRTVTPTAFNMAASIVDGTTTIGLTYDDGHSRIKQTSPSGTTYYLNDPASGDMSELFGTSWHDFLIADGQKVGERFCTGAAPCTSGAAWNYFTLDHLGSVASITDGTGTVVERDAYDPWGKRRNVNGADDPACALTSLSTRGFTGHEHIDAICEINANARIYDPTVARFIEPDIITANWYAAQDFNRYSYVGNNPTGRTDPSGQFSDMDLGNGPNPFKTPEDRRAAAVIVGSGVVVTAAALGCVAGGCEAAGLAVASRAPAATMGVVTVANALTEDAPATGSARAAGGKVELKTIPDSATVVRGGTGEIPEAGQTFSGAAGDTLQDAAQGVPHGTIRATTAGEIRAAGGKVEHAPEMTRSGKINDKHVNVTTGEQHTFGPPQPNPIPRRERN